VGLALQNKPPSPPKLKSETLQVSGIFVKFEYHAPLHERKIPPHKRKAPPIDDFLATVLYRIRFFFQKRAALMLTLLEN